MASGELLSYRRLWRSSFRMWLVSASAAPFLLFMFAWAKYQCPGCDSPSFYMAAIAIALILTGILALIGVWIGLFRNANARKSFGGAFDVSYLGERHQLTQRVHTLAARLKLPPPKVGLMATANAFAVGASPKDASVILGIPLLSRLRDDELDAVIGHELGHIASGDMNGMQMALGYQQVFEFIFAAFGHLFGFVLQVVANVDSRIGRDVAIGAHFSHLFAWLARCSIAWGSALCLFALSRRREFHADKVGAFLTTPDAMARALRAIHGVNEGLSIHERKQSALMFRGPGAVICGQPIRH